MGAPSFDDDGGRTWLDDEGRFLFGKYGPAKPGAKGETAEDVAQDDPSYVRWITENLDIDICNEDRGILTAHLSWKGGGGSR